MQHLKNLIIFKKRLFGSKYFAFFDATKLPHQKKNSQIPKRIIRLITQSGLLDANWYLENYPDVAQIGYDPVLHYLKHGATEKRNPGPEFDTNWYLKSNPDVAKSGLNPLYHYLAHGQYEGRTKKANSKITYIIKPPEKTKWSRFLRNVLPVLFKNNPEDQSYFLSAKKFTVEELIKKLWGGYSRYALPTLDEIKHNTFSSLREREKAAWELMRWFYTNGDFNRAIENLSYINNLNKKQNKKNIYAEAICLIKLQQYRQANRIIDNFIKQSGEMCHDYLLLKSTIARHLKKDKENLHYGEEGWLYWINKIYDSDDLAHLKKKNSENPLCFTNLTANAKPCEIKQDQKVSIIMPVFNGETTVKVAIESLLEQTWHNIELIVVDDASTDATSDIIYNYAENDSRIKLVRKSSNEGAYPARNTGLNYITGDLVMVHDADDWSHPQKIEIQVRELQNHSDCVAVITKWEHFNNNLEIIGKWFPSGQFTELNISSLMFKTEILDYLKSWDNVRVSGDNEFRYRIIKYFGPDKIYTVPDHYLLSIALSRRHSLTREESTHIRTQKFGLRWQYMDAYQYWHNHSRFLEDPGISLDTKHIPKVFGNKKTECIHKYDVVFISDFGMAGGAFISTLIYIIAASKSGKKIAVYHIKRYDLNITKNLNPELYETCVKYGIDLITHGDNIETESVFIGYPVIFQHQLDAYANIRTERVIVIINQFSSRLIGGEDPQYDPLVVKANLQAIFGQKVHWIPISNWVKRLMNEDKRYPVPYPHPWYPTIDTNKWCAIPLRWRGDIKQVPVVGRHGRDAYTKWPVNKKTIKLAYGVNQSWDVRLLGGANHAINKLGKLPNNWTVMEFNSVKVMEFLSDLDFFIHYPHEDYIEEFGRAVMEAMAVGIPVILPHQFKDTFGEAAIYAKAEKVSSLISELWESEALYLERACIGRKFVIENCNIDSFDKRIQDILTYEKHNLH